MSVRAAEVVTRAAAEDWRAAVSFLERVLAPTSAGLAAHSILDPGERIEHDATFSPCTQTCGIVAREPPWHRPS